MSTNDVFSALNIGSGMNTTELIQNLLTAERAPQEKKINENIDKNEVSVSAIAELKKSISVSSKTIDAMEGTNVFEGSSTSTSVKLTVTDPATVKEMSSSVNVLQLATSQTLVFDGFSSASLKSFNKILTTLCLFKSLSTFGPILFVLEISNFP